MTLRNELGPLSLEATQKQIRDADIATRDAQIATRDALTGAINPSGSVVVSSTRARFRDGFAQQDITQPDGTVWTVTNETPDSGNGQGHLIDRAGDSQGASYLRVSLSPFVDNTSVFLTSKAKYKMPLRVGWGISMSQRFLGQEAFVGVAQADDVDTIGIKRLTAYTDQAIVGTVTIATNVGTFNIPNHGLRGGDRVVVINNVTKQLNVGPVTVTVVDANNIQLPVTLTNGTYTAGGAVRIADPAVRAYNCFGLLFEQATVTQATLVARRNGAKYRTRVETVASTAATQATTSPYSDSFMAQGMYEELLNSEEVSYRSWVIDANSGISGINKWQQSVPEEDADYRLMFRARSLDDFSKPIARVTNLAKTGTTTATVTTDRPHGLVVGDRIGVWGGRDQTTWSNINDVAVASVVDATTFTAVFGSATTASTTTGGVIFINHGGVNSPGAYGFGIQQIQRTNNVLTVTLNTTAAGFVVGEMLNLWGMNGAGAAAYEGAYKIMRQTGSTVELWSPGADFAAITTGGALIKRTDVRLHFVRLMDHTRQIVEVAGGRGNTSDANNAVPVAIASAATLNINSGIWVSPGNIVAEQAPLTSTALTASQTYTQTTVDQGTTVQNRATRVKVNVMHTAGNVHGTLILQESVDGTTFRETWRQGVPSDGLYHTFDVSVRHRYYRFLFINGTVAQTAFWLSYVTVHGEGPTGDVESNLAFPLTPVAGSSLALNTTLLGPTIDLGGNHMWDRTRFFVSSDQAATAFLQASMDGSTWFSIPSNGSASIAAGAATVLEAPLSLRYVRGGVTMGSTAATALRMVQSLLSL